MTTKLLKEQFGIPLWVRGETPAEMVASINKKFDGREADHATKEDILENVASMQEYQKMQTALAQQSQEVPDQMNGEIPEGMDDFASQNQLWGGMAGATGGAAAGGGGGMNWMNMLGNMGGMTGGGQQGGQGYLNYENSNGMVAGNASDNQTMGKVKDTVSSAFGPWGMMARQAQKTGQQLGVGVGNMIGGDTGKDIGAGISDAFSPEESTMAVMKNNDATAWEKIGGTVPILGGVINRRLEKKAAREKEMEAVLGQSAQMIDTYKYGGTVNKYQHGGPHDELSILERPANELLPGPRAGGAYDAVQAGPYAGQSKQQVVEGFGRAVNDPLPQIRPAVNYPFGGIGDGSYYSTPDGKTHGKRPGGTNTGKALDWLGKNYGDVMGYAPLLGNITQKINRAPSFSRPLMIGKNRPNLIDERAVINPVQNYNKTMLNAARGLSGGDKAGLQAMLTGINAQGGKNVGQAALGVTQANNQEKAMVRNLDQRRQMVNLQQMNADITDRRMDEAAYQSAKSAKRSAIFEDIGKIGREESNKKLVKEMFGYSWDGRYFRDNKGTIITNDDGKPVTQKEMAEAAALLMKQKKAEGETPSSATPGYNPNANMFGGYLKRR